MTSSTSVSPPKVIESRHACPPIPADIRKEIGRRTTVPPEKLTKAQVMNLIRRFGTSEIRKDQKMKQLANLYDRCRREWFK